MNDDDNTYVPRAVVTGHTYAILVEKHGFTCMFQTIFAQPPTAYRSRSFELNLSDLQLILINDSIDHHDVMLSVEEACALKLIPNLAVRMAWIENLKEVQDENRGG